jgi:hypothetical protein
MEKADFLCNPVTVQAPESRMQGCLVDTMPHSIRTGIAAVPLEREATIEPATLCLGGVGPKMEPKASFLYLTRAHLRDGADGRQDANRLETVAVRTMPRLQVMAHDYHSIADRRP